MSFVLVAGIVFAGVLTQSMIGFGVALICMPLLISILDPTIAATLVALFSLPLQLAIIWRYRAALQMRPFWRVMVGSVVGIPLGVLLLMRLDRSIVLGALGILLIGYALYSLLRLKLPALTAPRWGFGFGLASGLLSGTYNTGGPPLVIYGTCLRWESAQFKANMQGLLLVNSILVIASHAAAGHITPEVLRYMAVALPVVAVGTVVGFRLSRYVNEAAFQRFVLVMLLLIGVRLLLP